MISAVRPAPNSSSPGVDPRSVQAVQSLPVGRSSLLGTVRGCEIWIVVGSDTRRKMIRLVFVCNMLLSQGASSPNPASPSKQDVVRSPQANEIMPSLHRLASAKSSLLQLGCWKHVVL